VAVIGRCPYRGHASDWMQATLQFFAAC